MLPADAWRARLLLAGLALLLPHGFAAADASLLIRQINRAFSASEARVRRGDTVRFLNQDDFDHQIYVDSPEFKFESDETSPGKAVDLPFTAQGTFIVHCHIHPKMHLTVIVN